MSAAESPILRVVNADATPEELRRDVELAKEANLDLLRIHAHVTRPEVYDAACATLAWERMLPFLAKRLS